MGIRRVRLVVADIPRSKASYQEMLGVDVMWEPARAQLIAATPAILLRAEIAEFEEDGR
jgi:hypothetical protein